MATQADVRRIAMALPAVEEAHDKFAFSVTNKGKAKGFVWVWQERVIPKKPRIPNDGVIAVRVANLSQKDLLLSAEPGKFFTEPHYNGFPAVLVRLDAVSADDLEILIEEAWRCQAPAELSSTDPGRALRPKKKRS
jgi:hypothetical protein